MIMKSVPPLIMLCMGVASIAACDDHRAAQDARHAPAASANTAPTHSFVVGTLAENDGDKELQGCTTSLVEIGAGASAGDTFRESSSATEGVGFIRVDGELIRLTLVHAESQADGVTLDFEDATHTLRVVEEVKAGETNENSDSTALSGSLTITYRGVARTLRVEGGTAC